MIPIHVLYILRYLDSNALTQLLLADELKKVLTAHKHLSGVGLEYFPSNARRLVYFVRSQPEETKKEGLQSVQCNKSDDS